MFNRPRKHQHQVRERRSSTCPPISYKLVASVIDMQGRLFHIDGTCIAYIGQQSIIVKVVVNIVDKSDSNTLLALVVVTKALDEAAQQRLDEDEREAVLQSSLENMSRTSQIAGMEEDDAVQVHPKRARRTLEPFAHTYHPEIITLLLTKRWSTRPSFVSCALTTHNEAATSGLQNTSPRQICLWRSCVWS